MSVVNSTRFSSSQSHAGLFRAVVCGTLFIIGVFPGITVKANESAAEQRISRVQNDLLPPVIIDGPATSHQTLAGRMQALHVPGVSIAVIRGGRLDWARGFGFARPGTAVTPKTLFQACSISKPVSATAILHLVQQGKLDLDSNVNTYLKTWTLPENEYTSRAKVTLRELLNHTAGVTISGFPGYLPGAPLPTLAQILDGESPADTRPIRVDMLPGIAFRYSGGGYVVAQRIVEDVTGKPFAAVARDTVLVPAYMNSSTYEQPLRKSLATDAAVPHDGDGAPLAGGAVIYPEIAPAGLWSTPTDLAYWAIEIQRALSGQSKILSKTTAREMLTPGLESFGLGLAIGGSPAHRYFTHSGVNAGFRTYLLAYEHGDGIVIMTNGANGTLLGSEIVRTVAEEYGWPDFRPPVHRISRAGLHRLDDLVGSYQLYRYTLMNITRDGDQLFVQRSRQPRLELLPERPDTYFLRDVDAQLVFDFDPSGKVAGFTTLQNGNTERARLLSESAAAKVSESLASRLHEATADARSEAVLHRYIEELRIGSVNYARLSVAVAQMTRQRQAEFTRMIMTLGAVRSILFKGTAPDGADIFEVQFENGPMQWQVVPTEEGNVDQIRFTFMINSVG